MANPSPKRVKLVQANVERLQASVMRLHDQCGHWTPEIESAVYTAGQGLTRALALIAVLPADYVPPRKAPVRSYTTLKIGDHVQVTDRAAKHTPQALVGCALEIVAFEGDLAQVKKDGVIYGVQRSALKLFETKAE